MSYIFSLGGNYFYATPVEAASSYAISVDYSSSYAEPTPGRKRRSALNLASMVSHTTHRNPADFLDYGRYCGLSNNGNQYPLDPIDRLVYYLLFSLLFFIIFTKPKHIYKITTQEKNFK